jgi:prepilin-type N-terminal cleavage/methylation domain-containing protein
MRARTQTSQSGFSLLEIAVVLIIMSAIAGYGISILRATLDTRMYSQTADKQRAIKDALTGFLLRNKRLPCPARPDATGAAQGAEPAGACLTVGTTGVSTGLLPYATLQLGQEAALDGWGNFLRYSVTTDWTTPPANTVLPFRSGITGNISMQNGITGAADTTTPITQGVIALISYGSNGYGAWTVKGTQNQLPAAGTDEFTNLGNNAPGLVIARQQSDTATPNGVFDDVVNVISSDALLSPLINNGQIDAPDVVFRSEVAQIHAYLLNHWGTGATPGGFMNPWGTSGSLLTVAMGDQSNTALPTVDYGVRTTETHTTAPVPSTSDAYIVAAWQHDTTWVVFRFPSRPAP